MREPVRCNSWEAAKNHAREMLHSNMQTAVVSLHGGTVDCTATRQDPRGHG